MNPDHYHPIVTECSMSSDCMCIATRGRANPDCTHFRKAHNHMSKSPKARPRRKARSATCRAVAATSAVQAENDKLVQQPGAKASNPKDALGIKKVPFSTISMPVLAELGVAMLEGALKYGRHNYRAIGVRGSVYFDANVARHQALWWEGEDEDPDTCEVTTEDTGVKNGQGHFVIPGTGLHHLTKAIAGLCVIRDAMIQGKFIDDRPPRTAKGWQDRLNKIVEALLKKYPTPVAPYIEGDERMK